VAKIRVPDIPGPTARLCWRQNQNLVRCDRRKGHKGRCSWDYALNVAKDGTLSADGFDAAIIGVSDASPGRPRLVVYDVDRMIRILVKRDGMTVPDAEEFLAFNTVGAWLGIGTPVFVRRKPAGVKPSPYLKDIFQGE
jgi:hypothetical protein